MKILIVFKEESDHAREVLDFIHEFRNRTGFEIQEINPDDPKNQFLLSAYDVVEYPTLLATTDDGRMLQMWRGKRLPTINEVSYYLYN